ncbi:protein Skeletor, isoforms B/C-like [Ctenocephalides felis]|uniref:protein Skeletor, isoforms B/C-like n=1 Tax=Ctenocephalides felis TaxID=7515 RepID=UPI000E6E102B|nr:protein Skeletor, isoforms B/C-like [Ctenocephalides felis]
MKNGVLCVKVLGQYRGVCKDDLVGGQDSFQLLTASRGEDGINVVTYRRNLISPDNGDKEYPLDREAFIVWAMGRLDAVKEPSFHDYYPKGDISVQFNSKEKINNCFKFTRSDNRFLEPWERPKIIDKSIRSFTATLGPSGGKRGYQGITGQTSSGLAWYINGMLVPELWLRRGLTYVFKVRGGNNPHSAEHYHPLIITDEPRGGFDRLTDTAQHQVRVLAGVEYTRRGRPKPTVAGPLCLAQHTGRADRRRDDDFPTFRRFNRTLKHVCEEGDPVELEVTPNSTWPDVVYYNSFTHSNMGWKIHIVDNFGRSNSNLIKIDLCLILLILTKTMSAVML